LDKNLNFKYWTMNNPLVSIILPVYNWQENWLIESIDSILVQTYENFELIIINDASTNDIEQVILRESKSDIRIKYIKNEINLNLSKTLNKGIELSKWEYIARIDQDDIWCDNDKLRKQVEFMENDKEYWVVWWNAILIDNNWTKVWIVNLRSSDTDIKNNILSWTQLWHSSVLIRMKCLKELGCYDSNWDCTEDHELWLRIWTKYKLYNFNEYFYKYRINNLDSIWHKNNHKQKLMIYKLALAYIKYYPNKLKWLFKTLFSIIIPNNIFNLIIRIKNG
jgi:glycosyltransferase involved in cell wall biosynthesis